MKKKKSSHKLYSRMKYFIKHYYKQELLKELNLDIDSMYSIDYIYDSIKSNCTGNYKDVMPQKLTQLLYNQNYNKRLPSRNILAQILKKSFIIKNNDTKNYLILNNTNNIPLIKEMDIFI